ncbi:MAG TPA: hypothetical protein VF257_07325 [Solirubrobacteraceae bacterium]
MPDDPFVFQLPSREREMEIEHVRLAWRDACADARLAYLAWQEARPSQAREAFAGYLAAADRETAAALAVVSTPSVQASLTLPAAPR